MKFIPKEELAFIVDHLDIDDACNDTMQQIFDIYGDDGTVWMCGRP